MELFDTLTAVEELLDRLHSVIDAFLRRSLDMAHAFEEMQPLHERYVCLRGRAVFFRLRHPTQTRHLLNVLDYGVAALLSRCWLRLESSCVVPLLHGTVLLRRPISPYDAPLASAPQRTRREATSGSCAAPYCGCLVCLRTRRAASLGAQCARTQVLSGSKSAHSPRSQVLSDASDGPSRLPPGSPCAPSPLFAGSSRPVSSPPRPGRAPGGPARAVPAGLCPVRCIGAHGGGARPYAMLSAVWNWMMQSASAQARDLSYDKHGTAPASASQTAPAETRLGPQTTQTVCFTVTAFCASFRPHCLPHLPVLCVALHDANLLAPVPLT